MKKLVFLSYVYATSGSVEARARRLSLSKSALGPVGDDATGAHADDAVSDAQKLLEIRRGDADRNSFVGKLTHQPMDRCLRLHIDAAREVVEKQHPRPCFQTAAKQNALLVAAGEPPDGLA